MSRKKSKSSPLDQVIGLAILAACAYGYWAIGGLGGLINTVLGGLINTLPLVAVAAATLTWRWRPVAGTRAVPVLWRMEAGARRLWTHPVTAVAPRLRPRVPAVLATLVVGGFLPFTADATAGRIALSVAEAAALAGALWALGHNPEPAPPPEPEPVWYDAESMRWHLIRAGVLKEGEGSWLPFPPKLIRGNAYGTTIEVTLPPGTTAEKMTTDAARKGLASSLTVAEDRLTVEAPRAAPANMARVFLAHASTPGARATPRPSLVTTMARTDWHAQPRIGATKQGGTVWALTFEANTLVASIMGYGKTSVCRQFAAHALLDPRAKLWIVDGKGSTKDYGSARDLCEQFIPGTAIDAVEQVESMLTELVGIVQRLNDASDQHATGYKYPALLILLDEWQDIRAAATGKAGERIDILLGRVVRMGRAVGVHVLVATQRPTVEDLPSGVRNLLSQRLVGVTGGPRDAALVLGETPTLPLPTEKGEFLVKTLTGTVAGQLDFLSDEDWETVCARARRLRGSVAAPPSPGAQEAPGGAGTFPESDPAVPAPSLPLDPTLSAVLDVLADGDPAGMTSAAILAALPGHLQPRPPSVLAMGKALAKWTRADHPLIRFKKTPSARLWQLTAPATAPATAPGGTRQDPPGPAIDPPFTRHSPATDPANGGTVPPLAANDGEIGPQDPEIGTPGVLPPSPAIPPSQEARQ